MEKMNATTLQKDAVHLAAVAPRMGQGKPGQPWLGFPAAPGQVCSEQQRWSLVVRESTDD